MNADSTIKWINRTFEIIFWFIVLLEVFSIGSSVYYGINKQYAYMWRMIGCSIFIPVSYLITIKYLIWSANKNNH